MSIRKELRHDIWKARVGLHLSITTYRLYPKSERIKRMLHRDLEKYRSLKRQLFALDEYVLELAKEMANESSG